MINYKKFAFLFITLCVCLLISTTLVSAEDNSNDTQTSSVIATQQTSLDNVVEDTSDNKKIVKKDINKKSTSKTLKESENIQKTTSKNKTTINTKSIKTTDKHVSSYSDLSNAIAQETSDNLNITLDSGDYSITSSISITNNTLKTVTINGNNQVVDGKGQYNFLNIASGVKVSLNNLVIQNSNNSAIINNGTLSTVNVTFKNNVNNATYGGALLNLKTVTINDSIFINNAATSYGGAIFNGGNLNITNSILNNNKAASGGAIFNQKNLTSYNTTYSNNLVNATTTNNTGGLGGAITNYYNCNFLSNKDTFANNSVYYSNKLGFGGAIYCLLTTLIINESTFVNNTASVGSAIYIHGGVEYNEIKIINSTFIKNNANRSTVYNGANLTIAGSYFINNTANSSAVIYNLENMTVNNCKFINNSALNGSTGVIYSNGNLTINNSLFTNNTSSSSVAVLYNSKNSVITNSTFTYNKPKTYFIIYNTMGNLTTSNNTFSYNTADKNYGVIYNTAGNLTSQNDIFENNKGIYGGAIYNQASATVINDSFTNNTATSYGGAIYNSGNLNITASIFNNNKANYGGAIINLKNITVNNSVFTNNNASNGAAIYSFYNSYVNLTNNTIFSNYVENGGIILNQNSSMIIENNIITDNLAKTSIILTLTNSTTTLKNNNVTNNTLTDNGYIIYGEGKLNTSNNIFINNTNSLKEDILFAPLNTTTSSDNVYINNSLATKTSLDNYTFENDQFTFNLSINLATVYNQTVNDGVVTVLIDEDVDVPGSEYNDSDIDEEIIVNVVNGKATVIVPNSLLTQASNDITFMYVPLNENYQSSSIQVTITKTIKNKSNITAQLPARMYANNTYAINITLTDNSTHTALQKQNITIKTETKNITLQTDANGIINYTYLADSSDKTFNISYAGSDDYYGLTLSYKINVYKVPTNLSLSEVKTAKINDKIELNATLTDNDGKPVTNKEIIFTINNQEYKVNTNDNGIATYSYTPTTTGTITVTVKYDGDEVYQNSTNTTQFTVEKIKTSLNIKTETVAKLNKTATITITLTDENNANIMDKEITLTVNGTVLTNKTNNDGIATFKYIPKTSGEYNAVAVFNGDDSYISSTDSTKFTVNKINTSIAISNDESVMIGGKALIKVTLLDEDGGKLTDKTIALTVGDVSNNIKTDSEGVATYEYAGAASGVKSITAKYEGDNYYNSNQTTSSITVTSKKLTNINVQADDTKINKTTTITVTLTDESNVKLADKTVNITINGETFTNKTNGDGVATFKYTPKSSGEITVVAKFTEDDTYASSSNTASFTVSKLGTAIAISDISSVKVNETAVITATLTDEDQKALSNKEITLTVNGTALTNTTNADGVAIFNYVPVHASKYTVNAVFTEDDSFLSSSNTAELTVTKLDTNIAINTDSTVMIGDKALIKVTLLDEDGKVLVGKQVSLTVDGAIISITTGRDGVASYNYTATSTGEKSITAKYDGDNDYNGNQTTSTITVTGKTVTNINVQAVDTKINKTTTITVTLTDGNNNKLAGKDVNVTVDGETFTGRTDGNGIATFSYTPTSAGEYNVVAEFVEDDTFEGSENSTVFAVNKLSTVISASVVNDTARNTVINVTLADENGNPIVGTVVVKDKGNVTLASGVTGSDGKVQIDLDLLAGSNSLTIVYDGSGAYLSNTSTVNVNVKQSDVKVDLPDYDMFLFDYSNITVNVTDEYGNPVNGGYVIFKVNGVTLKSNGKFYSQETNPMKFTVTNGKATIVFNATSFYNKKYVHSMIVKYSGTTSQYNSASSTTKTLSINKRIGYMTVTTDKTSYNLYETVNIKATYYDITHGNTTPIYADGSCYAIYKINGVTSKVNGSDEKFAINNSQVLIGNNSKSQINYIHIDHTAPNKKEYHTIEVKTHNEYYTTLVGNTTITLNKSPTHIDINKVTYNKTSNKITISADIKDYKNNNTKGVNYYSVKINGITYKANGQTTFNTTGGNIEITINSTTKNLRNIELVTREKLAYEGSRNTTTNIQTVK